jgi:hypothetical protein
MIYNSLYRYLKEFNLSEMHNFSQYARECHQRYKIDDLQMTDMGKMDEFLADNFGYLLQETQP